MKQQYEVQEFINGEFKLEYEVNRAAVAHILKASRQQGCIIEKFTRLDNNTKLYSITTPRGEVISRVSPITKG